MKIEITYPRQSKQKMRKQKLIAGSKWVLLFAAYLCPILNLSIGGKAWSIIVLWSIWMVWSFILSPDMVEYNRISQISKLITHSAIMLVLIELFIRPGWVHNVMPLVFFCGLVLIGVLFFSDLDRQKQNMMPMIRLVMFSVLTVVVAAVLWHELNRWEYILLGASAVALMLSCYIALGRELPRELKKRFSAK